MQIYKPKITYFETKDELIDSAAIFIFDYLWGSCSENGVGRLALSSGKNLIDLYKKIINNSMFPWPETEIYQVDENLASDDKKDFQKRFKEQASEEFEFECKELNFFDTNKSITESLQNYNEKLDSLDGVLFDLVIVEINEDGSFAAIFPNSEHLKHQKSFTMASKNEKTGEVHLGFSIETILNANTILAISVSKEEEDIVGELLGGEVSVREFPAKILLAHPDLHLFQVEV